VRRAFARRALGERHQVRGQARIEEHLAERGPAREPGAQLVLACGHHRREGRGRQGRQAVDDRLHLGGVSFGEDRAHRRRRAAVLEVGEHLQEHRGGDLGRDRGEGGEDRRVVRGVGHTQQVIEATSQLAGAGPQRGDRGVDVGGAQRALDPAVEGRGAHVAAQSGEGRRRPREARGLLAGVEALGQAQPRAAMPPQVLVGGGHAIEQRQEDAALGAPDAREPGRCRQADVAARPRHRQPQDVGRGPQVAHEEHVGGDWVVEEDAGGEGQVLLVRDLGRQERRGLGAVVAQERAQVVAVAGRDRGRRADQPTRDRAQLVLVAEVDHLELDCLDQRRALVDRIDRQDALPDPVAQVVEERVDVQLGVLGLHHLPREVRVHRPPLDVGALVLAQGRHELAVDRGEVALRQRAQPRHQPRRGREPQPLEVLERRGDVADRQRGGAGGDHQRASAPE
jgi:hypothetical protein